VANKRARTHTQNERARTHTKHIQTVQRQSHASIRHRQPTRPKGVNKSIMLPKPRKGRATSEVDVCLCYLGVLPQRWMFVYVICWSVCLIVVSGSEFAL